MSQGVPAHPCFVKSEQTVLIGEFRGTKKASQQLSSVTEDASHRQQGHRKDCSNNAVTVHLSGGGREGTSQQVATSL